MFQHEIRECRRLLLCYDSFVASFIFKTSPEQSYEHFAAATASAVSSIRNRPPCESLVCESEAFLSASAASLYSASAQLRGTTQNCRDEKAPMCACLSHNARLI